MKKSAMAFRTYSALVKRDTNDPTELKLAQLKRIISTVYPAAGRRLPGFNLLPRLFRGSLRLNISVASTASGGTDRVYTNIDCDEVVPNIFIGDEGAALNKDYLRLIGVTHVLNTAEGTRLGQVNTGSQYYQDEEGDDDDEEEESVEGESDSSEFDSREAPVSKSRCRMTSQSRDSLKKIKSKSSRRLPKKYPFKYMGLNLVDLPGAPISAHFPAAAAFIDSAVRLEGGKVLVHCLVGLSRSATIVLAYLMLKRGLTVADALKLVRRGREVNPNDGFLRQLIELDTTLAAARKAALNNNNNTIGDKKKDEVAESESRSPSSTSMTPYCDSHPSISISKSKERKLTN